MKLASTYHLRQGFHNLACDLESPINFNNSECQDPTLGDSDFDSAHLRSGSWAFGNRLWTRACESFKALLIWVRSIWNISILLLFSHSIMSNSLTPWIVAHQASLSMEFSRQKYHFLLQGIFLTQDWTHVSFLAGRFFITKPPGKPCRTSLSGIRCVLVDLLDVSDVPLYVLVLHKRIHKWIKSCWN